MNERLIRPLLGIASCATKCICCEMHRDIASRAIKEYRASLSGEEAEKFDQIFRTPFDSAGLIP